MARRRSEFESFLGDLLGFLRMVPWWVGPIVIALSWVLFAYVMPWVLLLIGALFGDGDKGFGRSLFTGLAHFPRAVAPYAAGVVGFVWVVALEQNFLPGRGWIGRRGLRVFGR